MSNMDHNARWGIYLVNGKTTQVWDGQRFVSHTANPKKWRCSGKAESALLEMIMDGILPKDNTQIGRI